MNSRFYSFIQKYAHTGIYIFAFMAWFTLIGVQKHGPPDFYKFFYVGEALYEGIPDFKVIPPLFPLLFYSIGKLFNTFLNKTDAFLTAARLITLLSGFGLLFFSGRILNKISETAKIPGMIFIAVMPFFLKLIAFPITDIVFLFWVALFFSRLIEDRGGYTLTGLTVIAACLTRFEGVLLIVIYGIWLVMKSARKRVVIPVILLVLVPLLLALKKYSFHFAARFEGAWEGVGRLLSLLADPVKLSSLIYGNFLFFVPHGWPDIIKWLLLIVFLALMIAGIYSLWKKDNAFTLVSLLFIAIFLVAKNYIDYGNHEVEFRRIVSVIWFVAIYFLAGISWFSAKYLERASLVKFLEICTGIGVVALIASSDFSLSIIALLPVLALIAVPSIWRGCGGVRVTRVLLMCSVLIFTGSVSLGKAAGYVDSFAVKAAVRGGSWLSYGRIRKDSNVLVYTHPETLLFYTDAKRLKRDRISLLYFTVPQHYVEGRREEYVAAYIERVKRIPCDNRLIYGYRVLMEKAARGKVSADFMIVDHYGVPERAINDVKHMLHDEAKQKDKFRIYKHLMYRGRSVGAIIKPVNAEKNI